MFHRIGLAFVVLSWLTTSTFAADKNLGGRELLFKLEADFAHDVAQHGRAAFVTHFAPDGVELEEGGGVSTREAISKQPAWPEGTSLSWTPVSGDMASSGDLGYTYGTYVFKSKDKSGKIETRYGKYMSVWKKQKDGSWKVAVDMGNASPGPQ